MPSSDSDVRAPIIKKVEMMGKQGQHQPLGLKVYHRLFEIAPVLLCGVLLG